MTRTTILTLMIATRLEVSRGGSQRTLCPLRQQLHHPPALEGEGQIVGDNQDMAVLQESLWGGQVRTQRHACKQ